MTEPKHRLGRLPGPRHLARLRLSMVVSMLEMDDADLGDVGEEHEFWRARQARTLELGARS